MNVPVIVRLDEWIVFPPTIERMSASKYVFALLTLTFAVELIVAPVKIAFDVMLRLADVDVLPPLMLADAIKVFERKMPTT